MPNDSKPNHLKSKRFYVTGFIVTNLAAIANTADDWRVVLGAIASLAIIGAIYTMGESAVKAIDKAKGLF